MASHLTGRLEFPRGAVYERPRAFTMMQRSELRCRSRRYLFRSAATRIGATTLVLEHAVRDRDLAFDGKLSAVLPHALANASAARLDGTAQGAHIARARALHGGGLGNRDGRQAQGLTERPS